MAWLASNLQAGVHVNLDDGPTRTWAVFGTQGLSAYDVEATGDASDRGRFAARLKASYDLLLTNRLVMQPEVEANFYIKADPRRAVASGLSDVDGGSAFDTKSPAKSRHTRHVLRRLLRPGRHLARDPGDRVQDERFTIGVRSWF